MSERIQTLMGKVLDGEATAAERAELDRYFADHPEDRVYMEEIENIGHLFRAEVHAELDAVDLSGVWSGVSAGLDDQRARPSVPTQPSLGERFRNWLDSVLPVPAATVGWAAAAAVLVIAAILSPRYMVGPSVAHGVVEVEQVETAADTTVMIYDTPDDNVTFIWVIEGDA